MAQQARLCFDENFDIEHVVRRTASTLEALVQPGASLEDGQVYRPGLPA